MRILITGAAGFIGYNLSISLLNDGFRVAGIDNFSDYYDINLKKDRLKLLEAYDKFHFYTLDIVNYESLSKIFKTFQPQKVVNLAAQPGVRYSFNYPHSYVDTNLVGFLNMIELSHQNNVDGFIYASSSTVYSNKSTIPFRIKEKTKKPSSLYGITKLGNELIAYRYSNLYNLHTTGLRYFTVYGPWNRPDMAISIFIKKIISQKTITVFNQGKMKRDFTYIDDIIIGTRSAIEKNYINEIFNLGTNKSEEIMDLISLLEEKIGEKAIIAYKPAHNSELLETCADISHSKAKIGFNPQVSLKMGIHKTVNWFKDYYNV